jgi:ubiquitin-like modifier-activating enzyme 5
VDVTERDARLRLFEFADFSELADKRVAVVGVGGLGAMAADIMARCGVGELALMDYDTLEEANLNRQIYDTSQIGTPKVDALKDHIRRANPDVAITTHPWDITDGEGFDAFMGEVREADLILGCVDTFHVRMFMNAKCVPAKRTLIDGGASQDGVNGSVHVIIPGVTPCYRCNRPLATEEAPAPHPRDDSGLCHFASLPTTMAIVASLQCQEALKFLLGFGTQASYLMYHGLEGTLERYDWERDPNCPTCGGLSP